MIYVLPPEDLENYRSPGSQFTRMLEPGTKYNTRDGLTPGTNDIRARCFRKEMHENPIEVSRVEEMIKNVMERKTSQIVEEELIELEEG